MPTLKQLQTYKANCEKEFQELTEKANEKIERLDDEGVKCPKVIKALESPTLLAIPVYPVNLDDETPNLYDLFEVIDRKDFDKGKIKPILALHPETRKPIDLDDLLIFQSKFVREDHIKKLKEFISNEPKAELKPKEPEPVAEVKPRKEDQPAIAPAAPKAAEAPKIEAQPIKPAEKKHLDVKLFVDDLEFPYTIDWDSKMTVLDLKQRLLEATGIPINEQIISAVSNGDRLYINKKTDDNLQLINLDLQFTIILRKEAAPQIRQDQKPAQAIQPAEERKIDILDIRASGGGAPKKISIPLNHGMTVLDLKKYIFKADGRPIENQQLITKGQVLENNELLADLNLHNKSMLLLKIIEPQAKLQPHNVVAAKDLAWSQPAINVEAIKLNIEHGQTPAIKNLCDALLVVLPRPYHDATRATLVKCLLDTISYYTEKRNHEIIYDFIKKLTNAQFTELTNQKNSYHFTDIASYLMHPGIVPPKAQPVPAPNLFAPARAQQVPPSPNPAPRLPGYDKFPAEAPMPHNQKAAPNRAVKRAEPNENTPIYKIVVAGDAGTGKSCLLLRYTDGTFYEGSISTIGVDFKVRTTEIPSQPNTNAKLKIWDTANNRNQYNNYNNYKGSDGIILTFDLTDHESFNNIKNHLTELGRCLPADIPKVLVGCKSDLKDRVIDSATAKEFAEELELPYIETSAKMDDNVDEAFTEIAELVYYKNHPEKKRHIIAEPANPIAKMIADFRNSKLLAFSDFDVTQFNRLTNAAKLDDETRKKTRESLVSAFTDKATKLANAATGGASAQLSKLTDEMCALENIRNTLSLIQLSFKDRLQFKSEKHATADINALVKSMGRKADEVTSNSPISKFNLALMKFKLIDYTSLEKLDPRPSRLLDYIASAKKRIEGLTKMKPKEPAQYYVEFTDIIITEIDGLHGKGKLNKDQRSALDELREQALSCSKSFTYQLPKDYTVADALRDAKSGADPLVAQHRPRN